MPTKRTTKAPTTALSKPMKIDMYVAYRHGDRDSWVAELNYADVVDKFHDYNGGGMPDEVVVISINLSPDGLTPEQRLRRFEVTI